MMASPSHIMLAAALMAVGIHFLIASSTPKPAQMYNLQISQLKRVNTMATPYLGVSKQQGMQHSSAYLIPSDANAIRDFSPSSSLLGSAAVMASSILLAFATACLTTFKLLSHQRTVPIFARHHDHALDFLEDIKGSGSQHFSAANANRVADRWDPLGISYGADNLTPQRGPIAMLATFGLLEGGAGLALNSLATTHTMSHITVLAFCPVCAMNALIAGFWLLAIPFTFAFKWIRELVQKLLRSPKASSSMALLSEDSSTDEQSKSAGESVEVQDADLLRGAQAAN